MQARQGGAGRQPRQTKVVSKICCHKHDYSKQYITSMHTTYFEDHATTPPSLDGCRLVF